MSSAILTTTVVGGSFCCLCLGIIWLKAPPLPPRYSLSRRRYQDYDSQSSNTVIAHVDSEIDLQMADIYITERAAAPAPPCSEIFLNPETECNPDYQQNVAVAVSLPSAEYFPCLTVQSSSRLVIATNRTVMRRDIEAICRETE